MHNRYIVFAALAVLTTTAIAGCSGAEPTAETPETVTETVTEAVTETVTEVITERPTGQLNRLRRRLDPAKPDH